jgi:hypothetical protein
VALAEINAANNGNNFVMMESNPLGGVAAMGDDIFAVGHVDSST